MRDGENGGLVVARDSDNLVWMFVRAYHDTTATMTLNSRPILSYPVNSTRRLIFFSSCRMFIGLDMKIFQRNGRKAPQCLKYTFNQLRCGGISYLCREQNSNGL